MQESYLSKPSSKVTDFVSQDAEANIQELRTEPTNQGNFLLLLSLNIRSCLVQSKANLADAAAPSGWFCKGLRYASKLKF